MTQPTTTEAAALIRAQAAEIARMGWQPIESAPKDGTRFDIWLGSPGYRVCDVYLAPNDRLRHSKTRLVDLPEWPTHWMPLPPPPTSDGEAG